MHRYVASNSMGEVERLFTLLSLTSILGFYPATHPLGFQAQPPTHQIFWRWRGTGNTCKHTRSILISGTSLRVSTTTLAIPPTISLVTLLLQDNLLGLTLPDGNFPLRPTRVWRRHPQLWDNIYRVNSANQRYCWLSSQNSLNPILVWHS